MNIENQILDALQTASGQAVSASLNPALPVKYIGFSQPKNADTWLELVYIPNNLKGEYWGNEKVYQGILRFVLHCPVNQEGVQGYMKLLESITDHFEKGSIFTDVDENVIVKIYEEPDTTSIIENPPEILVVGSVWYRCFKI